MNAELVKRLRAIAKVLKAHEWKIPVAERAPLFLDDTIEQLEKQNAERPLRMLEPKV